MLCVDGAGVGVGCGGGGCSAKIFFSCELLVALKSVDGFLERSGVEAGDRCAEDGREPLLARSTADAPPCRDRFGECCCIVLLVVLLLRALPWASGSGGAPACTCRALPVLDAVGRDRRATSAAARRGRGLLTCCCCCC